MPSWKKIITSGSDASLNIVSASAINVFGVDANTINALGVTVNGSAGLQMVEAAPINSTGVISTSRGITAGQYSLQNQDPTTIYQPETQVMNINGELISASLVPGNNPDYTASIARKEFFGNIIVGPSATERFFRTADLTTQVGIPITFPMYLDDAFNAQGERYLYKPARGGFGWCSITNLTTGDSSVENIYVLWNSASYQVDVAVNNQINFTGTDANIAHTFSASFSGSIEPITNDPPPAAPWTALNSATWVEYTPSESIAINQIYQSASSTYWVSIQDTDNTTNPLSNTSDWNEIPTFPPPAWNADDTYNTNDCVTSDTLYYRALTSITGDPGSQPPATSGDWVEITEADPLSYTPWPGITYYQRFDIVESGSDYYRCTTGLSPGVPNNTGNQNYPPADNTTKWAIVPSASIAWNAFNGYQAGDGTIYLGTYYYTSGQITPSTLGKPPWYIDFFITNNSSDDQELRYNFTIV